MEFDDVRKLRMKKAYKDTLWSIILLAMFVEILILLFFYSYNRDFEDDELEHIHTAWKILQGQEIYVDFFQHHHPFLDYLLVPIVSIFGDTTTTIFVSRYLILLMVVGILTVTYLLALRLFKNSEIGLISVILTSTVVVFYWNSIEVRPDVPQTFAGLVSIYFLFVYYDNKSVRSLITSAVFLAVSFLFLQKAITLILPLGALILYDFFTKKIQLKEGLLYAGAFIVTLAPYFIYLLVMGSLEKYFVLNWLVNINLRSSQGYPGLELLLEIFRENTITIMFYVIGVITLLRSKYNRNFVLLSLGLILTVFLMYKSLWRQYFIMVMPLIGIVSSYALYSVIGSRINRLIVILTAIYLPLGMMHDYQYLIRNHSFDNRLQSYQLERINFVLSITNENDKIYDGDIDFNLYRDDIDYFWFCLQENDCLDTYRKITDYEYDIYELISTHKPKVISTDNIKNLNDERIKNYYRASEKYNGMMIRVE